MKNKDKTIEDRIVILCYLVGCDEGFNMIRDTLKKLKEFIEKEKIYEYVLFEDTEIIENKLYK